VIYVFESTQTRFLSRSLSHSVSFPLARLIDNMTYASVSSRVVDHIKAYWALNFHTCAQVPPRAYTCSADTTLNIGVNTLHRTRRRVLEWACARKYRRVRRSLYYTHECTCAHADFLVPKNPINLHDPSHARTHTHTLSLSLSEL